MNQQQKLNIFANLIRNGKTNESIFPFLRWYFLIDSSTFHIGYKHYKKEENKVFDEQNNLILEIRESILTYDIEFNFHQFNLVCGIKTTVDEDDCSYEIFYILFENGLWHLYDDSSKEYSSSYVWKEKTLV